MGWRRFQLGQIEPTLVHKWPHGTEEYNYAGAGVCAARRLSLQKHRSGVMTRCSALHTLIMVTSFVSFLQCARLPYAQTAPQFLVLFLKHEMVGRSTLTVLIR